MATIEISHPIAPGELPAGVWETFRHPASPNRRRMPKRLAAQAVRVSADRGGVRPQRPGCIGRSTSAESTVIGVLEERIAALEERSA